MPFSLPNLPYAYNALEPVIDEATMRIHHTKHHQGYINKLNAGLEPYPEYADWSLEDLLTKLSELPDDLQDLVRNHGGGHANHSLFREIMRPAQYDNRPEGPLALAIDENFGSFERFQELFAQKASTQFGSGRAWLVKASDGVLEVRSTANQDSPLLDGQTPLLGLDVREHAYYLSYQNKRADYIAARWSLVNWEKVEKLYSG